MNEFTICIAGNPNVGKSTIFNALAGRNRHTVNWPGTMIAKTEGKYPHGEIIYDLLLLPGSYSLSPSCKEEEITKDYILFEQKDAILMICDATRLDQSLPLLLQVLEAYGTVIVCMNRMDDALKNNIAIDTKKLEDLLNVPVIPTIARKLDGLLELIDCLDETMYSQKPNTLNITYGKAIEEAIAFLCPYLEDHFTTSLPVRWIALTLLEHDLSALRSLEKHLGLPLLQDEELQMMLLTIHSTLESSGIDSTNFKDMVTTSLKDKSDSIYGQVVSNLPSKKRFLSQNLGKLLGYTKP